MPSADAAYPYIPIQYLPLSLPQLSSEVPLSYYHTDSMPDSTWYAQQTFGCFLTQHPPIVACHQLAHCLPASLPAHLPSSPSPLTKPSSSSQTPQDIFYPPISPHQQTARAAAAFRATARQSLTAPYVSAETVPPSNGPRGARLSKDSAWKWQAGKPY